MGNSVSKPLIQLNLLTALCSGAGVCLSFLLLASSTIVLAHGGHGDEFPGTDRANDAPESIKVDTETAQRLGIKIKPVTRKHLDISIKTTGQIETLPSKKVEVTNPIPGKVTELLVEPGASIKAGQPVAVLASGELVELRVTAAEKRAEALANFKQARADLQLAQENLKRQKKIAVAEIAQTQTEVTVAQEKYARDKELAEQGALPRRILLESQAHLADGKAQLAKAVNQQEVIKAENEIKRAQASVEVAQSRLQLSNVTYQTRLQQLGTIANEKGLVVVKAPISGKVADREVTLGQAFQDAGIRLMTIVNDNRVFATANIFEKDLGQVKLGQRLKVKVASLPHRTFTGKITQIGAVVEQEKRVVPIKAELDNFDGQLKPGLFAELEIITDQTSTSVLAIPNAAVVEANNKKLVYVQNGNAFDAVEVTLGQTAGDLLEVKTGLFEGDLIVTQRAPQLYAQSLRGGTRLQEGENQKVFPATTESKINSFTQSWWFVAIGIGIIGAVGSIGFWAGRSSYRQTFSVLELKEKDKPKQRY
jgi:cobalt-zinc-cadmium efflux system membrane fusion protein